MKYAALLVATFTIGSLFSADSQANTRLNSGTQNYAPSLGLMIDYVNTDSGMYGLTLAPKHYDPDFADWGYYIGYARGDKTDLEFSEPAEGHIQEYMWRFGVSYSLSQDFSVYTGATVYIYETNTTDGIMPLIVGGEPEWEQDKDKNWGAEFGMRYQLTKDFIISAGYDTRTEAAIISFGFSS
ncbi:TonB-dependent receptor [Shewanella maritima]|uniref:TonB-dependent receptor n=1 Tax=Shewanella maritima TaxID=2520507 RepID=UPI0037365452